MQRTAAIVSESIELVRTQRVAEALALLDRAIGEASRKRDFKHIAERDGQLHRAELFCRKVLEHFPEDELALFGLGNVLGRQGDITGATDAHRLCHRMSLRNGKREILEMLPKLGKFQS